MNIATRDCGRQLCRYWDGSQDQHKQNEVQAEAVADNCGDSTVKESTKTYQRKN